MRKKELELMLEKLKPLSSHKVWLEQYQTSPSIAADLLFKALMNGDIKGKKVLDACCGNGILGIGAAILGARVKCIDIDPDAIKVAKENCERLKVDVEVEQADFFQVRERFDTILMNPPFGLKGEKKDVDFLMHAFQLSDVIYSFHKKETLDYLNRLASLNGFNLLKIAEYDFIIPKIYEFHRKPRKSIKVCVLNFRR